MSVLSKADRFCSVWLSSRFSVLILFICGIIIGYYTNSVLRYGGVAYSVYIRKQGLKAAESTLQKAEGIEYPGIHDRSCENTAFVVAGMCPGFETKDQLSKAATVNQLQAFLNFTMPTDGIIVAWRFYQTVPEEGVEFYMCVVRTVGDRFVITSRNRLTSSNIEGWIEQNIDSNDRAIVKTGDFVGIVYESLDDEPLVGAVDASTSWKGTKLSDGAEYEIEAFQMDTLFPIGEPIFVTIDEMMASDKFEVHRNWRFPAIQAIILKT